MQHSSSATVPVYRLSGFRHQNGIHHGETIWRQCFKVTKGEANMLTSAYKVAVWRGRKKDSLTLLIPMKSLLLFIGQMRFKQPVDAVGIDSRTHRYEGGAAKYSHVRNAMYSPSARTWQ